MSYITIKKSHLEGDLLVLKSALESEGIKCYLKNEFTTQIINFMPTFVVELQISISDFEKAKTIINEINTN